MTTAVFEINCLGQKCPLPVTRLERAHRDGHIFVRLTADDPISRVDIPVALYRLGGSFEQHETDVGIVFDISFA